MQFLYLITLFLVHIGLLAFALQVGRGLSQITGHISTDASTSSPSSRHSDYVDQRVRQNPYAILNHESYHHRNVVSGPLNDTSSPSNTTSDAITAEEGFILPDTAPSDDSTNPASSSSDTRLTDIPELLRATTATQKGDVTDEEWKGQTNKACLSALSALRGVSSNPAGVAVCYNIRTFDSDTGSFKADLRLYQVEPPAGEWTRLESASEALDVAYSSAQVVNSKNLRKRENIKVHLNYHRKADNSLHAKRSNDPPRMLQGLAFSGMIQGDFSQDIADQ